MSDDRKQWVAPVGFAMSDDRNQSMRIGPERVELDALERQARALVPQEIERLREKESEAIRRFKLEQSLADLYREAAKYLDRAKDLVDGTLRIGSMELYSTEDKRASQALHFSDPRSSRVLSFHMAKALRELSARLELDIVNICEELERKC